MVLGEVWFAVLPDGDVALHAARVLRAYAGDQVAHPSGRPWLLGRWPAGWVQHASGGGVALATVGHTSLSSADLAARLAGVGDLGALSELARAASGGAHLLASVGGEVRAQGSVSGVRRVFHVSFAGVTVAGDRADTLAALVGAAVDDARLALRLLSPTVAHPLDELPLWREVRAVPPDSYLRLGVDGRAVITRWWKPPPPTLTLASGADAVRSALTEAVDVCTAGGGTVSCDRSGELAAVGVALLAGRGKARLLTAGWLGVDPRPRARLGAPHVVLGSPDGPPWFAGATEPAEPTEEPLRRGRDRASAALLADRMVAEGARLHLCGRGGGLSGDQWAEAWAGRTAAYLHDLVRRRPLRAARLALGRRTRGGWPLGPTLRALADGRGFPGWLALAGERLTEPPESWSDPPSPWGPAPRLPSWSTPAAVEAVRAELAALLARGIGPLAPGRGEHHSLELVRAAGLMVRQLDQVMRARGLPLAAPLLDDRVIEATLAVRARERLSPFQREPLLDAALAGVVPAELPRQTGAGEPAAGVYAAFRRHRAELVSLLDGSLLAERGLVDLDALRAALLAPHPDAAALRPFEPSIGCECWLRALPDPRALASGLTIDPAARAAGVRPIETTTGGVR